MTTPTILTKRAVVGLKRLQLAGTPFGNYRPSCYAVGMIAPVETAALDRMLEPVTNILTRDVAQGLAEMRADPQLQARIDELASKANEGQLTEAEQREYHDYVEAIDFIGVLQAKARAVLARTTSV